MRACLIAIASLLTLAGPPAHADDAALRQQFVGIWKPVAVDCEDQETKARTLVLGAKPRGQ